MIIWHITSPISITFPVTSRMKSQQLANRTTSTNSIPSSNPLMPAIGNVIPKLVVRMPPVPVKLTNLTNLQSPTANWTTGKTTPAPTEATPATTTTTTLGPHQTTPDDHLPALPTANPTSPLSSEKMAS